MPINDWSLPLFSCLHDYYMSFPRPIRRLARRYGLFMVAILLAAIALFALWPGIFKQIETHLGRFSVLPFLALQFLASAGYLVSLARLRRAFRASGGCLCTDCAHNVSGLGDQGNCPECGHWFNIEVDRIAWRASGIELKKPR